jgi:peptidoglycan/LPS O-acetylase OafA/YrhL
MVVLVLLLLLAAALGILGAVIKATLVVVFALILLGAISYYYVRHKFRRFVREVQRRQTPGVPPGRTRSGRGYPTTGTKGPGPQLPE